MTDNTEGLCTVKYEKLKSANSEVRNSKICIITESTAAMNKDIYEKTNVNIQKAMPRARIKPIDGTIITFARKDISDIFPKQNMQTGIITICALVVTENVAHKNLIKPFLIEENNPKTYL